MVIETERLTLCPLGTEHLETAHAYSSDKELTKLMVFLPRESLSETRKFLEDSEKEWAKDEPSFYRFAVMLDGVHIGCADIEYAENGMEIGWILASGYHGMGYATEAAKAVMDFGRSLGVKHFIAHCDTENTASRRVMEKLGMICTGEFGGRKNRSSDEERREYVYEIETD